jgi:hypothetical protein
MQRLPLGPGPTACLAAARLPAGAAAAGLSSPAAADGGAWAGRVLLAAAGQQGWLRVVSVDAGHAPPGQLLGAEAVAGAVGGGAGSSGGWRLEHSLEGLTAPLTALTFGPWADTLAAAGPAAAGAAGAAALGRGAAAAAATGGAAGCVSVWERRPRADTAAAGAGGVWRLCQQWGLAAAPAGAAFVAAASAVQLAMSEAAPGSACASQSLCLLALPGPTAHAGRGAAAPAPVVLRGSRRLELPGPTVRGGAAAGGAAGGGAGDGLLPEDSGVWPDAARR